MTNFDEIVFDRKSKHFKSKILHPRAISSKTFRNET